MKQRVFIVLSTALFLLTACSQPATVMPTDVPSPTPSPSPSPVPPPTPTNLPGGWSLVWSDEFDGPAGAAPDAENWRHDVGGQGWGNQEWEYYTGSSENAFMDGNGSLVIRAIALADSQTSDLTCWYGPCRYTSARLLTLDHFDVTYGRIEARIQLPYGQGVWPAFWMLGKDFGQKGWPGCGEIDIMENIGSEPSKVHGTVHGPGYSGGNGISHTFSLPEGQAFKDGYHVFALEWDQDTLHWYVDQTQYAMLTKEQFTGNKAWVFDHPFFIILNVAVGGSWPGYPDATSTFPQEMKVDYVRVYKK